jgi:hypothetical protein
MVGQPPAAESPVAHLEVREQLREPGAVFRFGLELLLERGPDFLACYRRAFIRAGRSGDSTASVLFT